MVPNGYNPTKGPANSAPGATSGKKFIKALDIISKDVLILDDYIKKNVRIVKIIGNIDVKYDELLKD